MVLSQIDAALLALSVVGQSLLFLVLWRREFYKTFPIFFSYILYTVVSDFLFLSFMWSHNVSKQTYFMAYFANNVPEFLLQLGILLEVARNVLSPVKRSLPKSALAVFAAMILSGTILACFLSMHSMPTRLNRWTQYFIEINFTVAVLRLVIFSAIVFFSQMLGIGWKNHVVQIATGFAGYSVVVLLVELLHRFTGVSNDSIYHFQEQFRIIAWCLALGYWSYALAKKEAERKEFSPKMASFLVFISSVVSKDRAATARLVEK
jgi:hypothetical protein